MSTIKSQLRTSAIVMVAMVAPCLAASLVSAEVRLREGASKVRFQSPAPAYRRQGYSVVRPNGLDWRVVLNNRKVIAFRKRVQGTPNSLIAFAHLMPNQARGYEGLARIAAKVTRTMLPTKAAHVTIAGARCVYKRFVRPARSRQREYILLGMDLYCLHPTRGVVVKFGFSQRYPRDGRPVRMNQEMQTYFNSVRFF